MTEPEPVRVFGENAENIKAGDLFEAHVRHVEGRRVVELKYAGNLQ